MESSVRDVASTIGHVEYVSPAAIRIALDDSAPQTVAIRQGVPGGFPRVNGYVLLPHETGSLVGQIEWLSASEDGPWPSQRSAPDLVELPVGRRLLSVTPVGTLERRWDSEAASHVYRLQRGVVSFPSVGDPAQIPTSAELAAIVEGRDVDRRVLLGYAPLAANASVTFDPDKLLGRHLAVLGNTGSGKSCSVAGIVRWSLEASVESFDTEDDWPLRPNSRFVILDPNGEYTRSFDDLPVPVRVLRVDGVNESDQLRVPAWAWTSEEWASFLHAAPGTQLPILKQALRALKGGASFQYEAATTHLRRLLLGRQNNVRAYLREPGNYTKFPGSKEVGNLLEIIVGEADGYAADPEMPKDISDKLEELSAAAKKIAESNKWESQKGATGFNGFSEWQLRAVDEHLDTVLALTPGPAQEALPNEDAPLPFNPLDLPGQLTLTALEAENTNVAQWIELLNLRLNTLLSHSRLSPVISPAKEVSLDEVIEALLGTIREEPNESGQITVVDLSLVPHDVVHVIIAVLARLVFETAQRYRRKYAAELPSTLVLEEAHTFVHERFGSAEAEAGARMCKETFERIAREGRKFGVGLVLSSQRPSELSSTMLAQCNTFLLHRLVNDRDQDLVKRLVPDNIGALLKELPSLPAQQAILLGWASALPTLTRIRDLPSRYQPASRDPHYWEEWSHAGAASDAWAGIASEWQDRY